MPNHLRDETSPYLLQHADNPVDWYPWSDAAFSAARELDKPVLLSIGYSACHWCHVMAHESFEDAASASLMNDLFVNIKVDREERPDLDRIYQLSHQLLTQRGGGWPLTMFLDPETRRPFFGGTYFPDTPRHGMPAFSEVLQSVAAYFRERRDEVEDQGARLTDFMDRLHPEPAASSAALNGNPLEAARKTLGRTFDSDYGGFGSAPKFPHPANIERLLRHWRAGAHGQEPDVEALYMATLTLTRMAEGGLFDHVGGGFCRYSVDRHWQIPHFEKMLYDNGPLLAVYAQAYLATGDEFYARVAERTGEWLIADMRAPNGGFYSTRDADSEGEEGRYYVWSPEEVNDLLTDDEYRAFGPHFGLDGPPNFEGHWHLAVQKPVDVVAQETGLDEALVVDLLASARRKLAERRAHRVAPARDEKQLTSWNALCIRGLAIAGPALDRPAFVDAAAEAIDFVDRTLLVDGRLRAVQKDGRTRFSAYLDDYAFMLDALLELLQTRWSGRHLALAIRLADTMLLNFEDRDAGGFWFTANDHERLITRSKPFADDATPSGNGVAALALQRLGFLLGESRYLDAAERCLRAAWQAVDEYPHGHATLLNALAEYLQPPEIIIIRGDDGEAQSWRNRAARLYAPSRLIFAIPAEEPGLPGVLAERKAADGETRAWCCIGTKCGLPATSWQMLAAQIIGK